MSFFNKQTILIDADIYHKYAGGGHDKKHIRYAYIVPAGTIRSDDRLKRTAIQKLISNVGTGHEIIGTASFTDETGNHTVRFRYQPRHETMTAPAGYQTPVKPASNSGDKFVKGVKAVSKAFDEFMGGGEKAKPKPKPKTTARKRTGSKTATRRKPATRKRNTVKKRK